MKRLIALAAAACMGGLVAVPTAGAQAVPEAPALGSVLEIDVNRNGDVTTRQVWTYAVTEYDANGREVHYTSTNGFEAWKDYNPAGVLLHYKGNDGDEIWYDCDENGFYTHCTYYDPYSETPDMLQETIFERDEGGRRMHSIRSDGTERWYELDAGGNILYEEDSSGYEASYAYVGSRITYSKEGLQDSFFKPEETWYEYDDYGRLFHKWTSGKIHLWCEYDDADNLSYSRTENEEGYVVAEFWYENDYRPDGTIAQTITYINDGN